MSVYFTNFTNEYGVDLRIRADVYMPRHPASDDVTEIEVLEAKNSESGEPCLIKDLDVEAVEDQILEELSK